MSDDSLTILHMARRWIGDGHRVALVTVVEAWGSAPRGLGSHMIVRDDGLFEGSASGGCVEASVLAAAEEVNAGKGYRRIEVAQNASEIWQPGLPCGGRIAVAVQPIDESGFPPALLSAILAATAEGRPITVSTDTQTGQSVAGTKPGQFVRTYEPAPRLLVVGAVHISQSLAPLARTLGFAVTFIDPRPAYAAPERFPGEAFVTDWPDEALERLAPDRRTAIVALTHDPKLDDPALAAALRSEAFYIAALGSRKSQAARLERLAALGFGDDELARIHGPAGLDIKAAGPAEIAVSIAAEMIAVLRGAA